MSNIEKSKRISDAIGELEEDIVMEADRERKISVEKNENAVYNAEGKRETPVTVSKKKKILIPAVSLAACAAITLGIIFGGGNKPNMLELPVYAEVLAEAEYPYAAPYPDESKNIESSERELWYDQRKERYGIWENIDISALNNFTQRTVCQFMTDSKGTNLVYSPANLFMALSMLAELTDGESRTQILELTGFDNMEGLRRQAASLWKALYRNDGATTTVLANSLWFNSGAEFKDDTIKRLADEYFASVYRGDLAEEKTLELIRNWINEQTGGLLKEAAEDLTVDPETVMLLCSTLYFKARWNNEFNPDKNDHRIFHGTNGEIETEFMNIETTMYFFGEDYTSVNLRFADGGEMWFILPDEGKTVDDLLNSGEYIEMVSNPSNWENNQYIRVNVSVPKFDVSSDTDIAGGLKELGVKDVFDPAKADFSPLADNEFGAIWVDKVQHAARVTVDEEGCTAEAFTVMAENAGGINPKEEIDFVLDRPFAFMITSGSGVLFAGTVNNLN